MNRAVNLDVVGRPAIRPISLSRLGDAGLAAIWTVLSVGSISATIKEAPDVSWLVTVHHTISSLILCATAVLFVFRRSAKTRIGSWRSRSVAIIGSWLMPVLILLPLTWTPDWLLTVSTVGLILGHAVVFWALLTLRRSFSIFPEARALIRTGPYALVRHPLYATYVLIYAMFLLPRLSVLAVVVTVLGIGCELWRARDEEAVLNEAFPDYSEYAAVTPRFFPSMITRLAR
jgi:protein-S-isoprenylcysteine O-methyltransferase Ste14